MTLSLIEQQLMLRNLSIPCARYKRSGGFQPKTKGMYSPTSPTHKSGVEEMGLRSLSPVDLSNEKGNEAAAELQQSALSTEGTSL